MPDTTVLLHLYYPGSWKFIKQKCAKIIQDATNVIITACHDDVIEEIEKMAHYSVLKVNNRGKDIGGKLVALSFYLNYCKKTDYIIFMHDKISPQTINADYWRNQLYGLFESSRFEKVIDMFEKNKSAGVIGSKTFLNNEYNKSTKVFNTTNNILLQGLIKKYELECRSFDFIAGTIFVARSKIYELFFSKITAQEPRIQLENNNVLDIENGTYTHCWERLFCFIANHYKYEICGIS